MDSSTDDKSGAESDKFESDSQIKQKYGRSQWQMFRDKGIR